MATEVMVERSVPTRNLVRERRKLLLRHTTGDIMPTVSVSETYDLSTKTNKMSLVAIHTPSKTVIKRSYPGLCLNYKFMKLERCDVKLACASLLPADPLQIGVEGNAIAPQDMFNPILYKAVTNEALSTIEARLRGLGKGLYGNADGIFSGESVDASKNNTLGLADDFGAYYNLLANRDGFRVAHPQAGLEMKGLVPLVYEKLWNYGDNPVEISGNNAVDNAPALVSTEGADGVTVNRLESKAMKGRAHPMPRIQTLYLTSDSVKGLGISGTEDDYNHFGDIPDIPRSYVACILLPPSKLNVLYYRLIVRWFITFSEVRPITDIYSMGTLGYYGSEFYGSDYAEVEKSMTERLEMVDCQDNNIQKIMEGK